jgi:integrase
MTNKIGIYKDVRNKGKPWVCRWYGEYDPATGKQKRYTKSFRLKVEAEAFRAERAEAFRKGQQRDKPEEVTVKDFCKDWLKTRKRELRSESVKLYKNTMERLQSYFGTQTLISKITPWSAARFIAELKRLDGKEGGLSDWARHRAVRHCRTIFEAAAVWELIPKNPFKNVKTPKLVVSPWHYLTPAEYKKLLKAAPSLCFKALYTLAYTGGLRFGELYSLTWKNIDFEAGEVKIENRPATANLPPFRIKDHEAWTIPLLRHTLEILEDLKAYAEAADEKTPYVLLEKRHFETVVAKWQNYKSQSRAWRNQDVE